jgi:hypothetical protein
VSHLVGAAMKFPSGGRVGVSPLSLAPIQDLAEQSAFIAS